MLKSCFVNILCVEIWEYPSVLSVKKAVLKDSKRLLNLTHFWQLNRESCAAPDDRIFHENLSPMIIFDNAFGER
jgi:hypothetical protein